jgi:osmotically-inducible protein OsmY
MRRTLVGMAIVSVALMVPFLVRADDQKIAEAIVNQIQEHMDAGRLKGFGIDLQVDKGIVELKGEVATTEQLDLILAAVAQAEGVKDVINEVKLKAISGVSSPKSRAIAKDPIETLEDKVLKPADSVLRKLEKGIASAFKPTETEATAASLVTGEAAAGKPYVRIKDIEKKPAARIVTEAGVAKPMPADGKKDLFGNLGKRISDAQQNLENIFIPKTETQKAPAGTTIKPGDSTRAQAVPPTARVVTQAVELGPSDQQIADDISKQLHARKEAGLLKGFGLRLHVKDGAIRLSGRVSKMSDRQMVGELARATYGVRQVVNELELVAPKVSEPVRVRVAVATEAPAQLPVVTDNQIAMMISGELKAKKENGTLTNFSLQMTVKDGKVWLQGYVPSRKQRDMAIAAAEAVEGVAEVINEIDIQLPITRQIAAMVPQALRPQGPLDARNLAQVPVAMAGALAAAPAAMMGAAPGQMASSPMGVSRARYEQPQVPNYAWPTYAAHPNYGAVTYPKQYSPSAWPYIGPFYPYPQVPLGWRKVTLEWDDGWWFLDFSSRR